MSSRNNTSILLDAVYKARSLLKEIQSSCRAVSKVLNVLEDTIRGEKTDYSSQLGLFEPDSDNEDETDTGSKVYFAAPEFEPPEDDEEEFDDDEEELDYNSDAPEYRTLEEHENLVYDDPLERDNLDTEYSTYLDETDDSEDDEDFVDTDETGVAD